MRGLGSQLNARQPRDSLSCAGGHVTHYHIVTGRMRSDRSGGVRRMANRNYDGNGGRTLIVAAQAAAQLN